MVVGDIETFYFCLWQVSRIWHVLPQLIYVNVDLAITIGTIGLTTTLAYGMVNETLKFKLISPFSSHTMTTSWCSIKVFHFILVVNMK